MDRRGQGKPMEFKGEEEIMLMQAQYTLLTEILKKAGISSSHLVHLIKDYGITPNWEHIPLPQGKSPIHP